MNFAAQVRHFISANPGVNYLQVAAALEKTPTPINKLCNKMAKRGLLVADRSVTPAAYRIGRAPLLDRESPAEVLAARNRASKRASDARRREREKMLRARRRLVEIIEAAPCEGKPAPVVAQTVDEFIARGGRVEILPGFKQAPPKCTVGLSRFF